MAVYDSSGLAYYRHSDWLGSVRLDSTAGRTVTYDVAYAAYGETYASTGTQDREFGGMEQDIVPSGAYPLYDALMREYHPTWGRWLSPDPAGLAAANPTNPQSWNRYAYVVNNPLIFTDPSGLYTWQAGNCIYNTVAVYVDGVFQGYDTILLFCYSGYGGGPPPSGGMGGAGASGSGSGSGGGAGPVPSLGKLTKQVNQCAAKNAPSIASLTNANQNNFFVRTFLGNDASAFSNLAFGPNRADAAESLAVSNPTKYSLVNLGAHAAGSVPTGGTIYVSSGQTVLTQYGPAIKLSPTSETVGETTASQTLGNVFGLLTLGKAFFDAGAYIYAEVGCAQGTLGGN